MARSTYFAKVMRKGRRYAVSLFVYSFLANILLLASSIYMLQVFDRVLASGSYDTLIWLSTIAILAIVAYGFLEYARRKMLSRTGGWITAELSPEIIRRSIDTKLEHGASPAGLGDLQDIRKFIGGDAILAFYDAPWTPAFIAIIWLMHPILGIITIAGALLLFGIALLNEVITRKTQSEAGVMQRESYEDARRFVDSAETLMAMGMVGSAIAAWRGKQQAVEQQARASEEVTIALYNLSRSVRLGLQIVILGAGAALVLQAELTAGGMIAASIILARALSPVERAITAWKSFGAYRLAKRRIEALFRASRDTTASISLPRPHGHLSVRELRYFTPDTRAPLIKSVSFQLAPGELCGVMGPSGSGKTSLCRLLVGAWRPSFGEIRLDGASLSDWNPDERGTHIGYLPQQVTLFSGTIAQNIARLGEVDSEAVIAAAMMAGTHELILSLPQGYETEVGDGKHQLSGGQKQRIGLARALYGKPSLVILDEPNANLDGNGEIALQRALKNMKDAGQTVVVVTHVPSLLRHMDKVAVIQGGSIAKFGDRNQILRELMAQGPSGDRTAAQQTAAE